MEKKTIILKRKKLISFPPQLFIWPSITINTGHMIAKWSFVVLVIWRRIYKRSSDLIGVLTELVHPLGKYLNRSNSWLELCHDDGDDDDCKLPMTSFMMMMIVVMVIIIIKFAIHWDFSF